MRRSPYPASKTFTTADGVVLNYELDKKRTGKPLVVLLHGLGGDLSAWDEERLLLTSHGYSVLTMDLRGHGLSSRPQEEQKYSLVHFAHDLRILLVHLGYEKAVVTGHCFGGVVAIMFADLYPEMVEGLVLIDTTYKPPVLSHFPVDPVFIQKCLRMVSQIAPKQYIHSYQDFVKAGYAKDWSILRIFRDLLHTSMYSWLLSFNTFFSLDFATTLRTLRVRTLVITGEEDTIFPPRIAQEIHHLIKHSEYVAIPLANHILVINNPVEVSLPLLKFLDQLPGHKKKKRGKKVTAKRRKGSQAPRG